MEEQSNTYSALLKENLLAGRGWNAEGFLAKNLPNRSHHKGYVWAHESRAELGPAAILNTRAQQGLV